jgi:hypothetical protein
MTNRIVIYVQDGIVDRVVADIDTVVYVVDLDADDEDNACYVPAYQGNLFPLDEVTVSPSDTRLVARTWETLL